MAAARKCDICGKLYNHYDQRVDMGNTQKDQKEREKFYKENGRSIMAIKIIVDGMSREYDVCPECGEKLRDCLGREVTNIH